MDAVVVSASAVAAGASSVVCDGLFAGVLVAAEAESAAEGSGTSEASAIALAEAVNSEVCDTCKFFAGDVCRDRCRVIIFDGGGGGLRSLFFRFFFKSTGSEATLDVLVVPDTLDKGERGAIGAASSGAALDEVSGGRTLAVVLGGATLGSSGGGKPESALNNALEGLAGSGSRGGDEVGTSRLICKVCVVGGIDCVEN